MLATEIEMSACACMLATEIEMRTRVCKAMHVFTRPRACSHARAATGTLRVGYESS